jgi:glycosyltransferase involved in cell wall biosynthesis
MANSSLSWICCQIGAREHYAIPRALYSVGQLRELITDAWVSPQSPIKRLPVSMLKPLQERFHPELSDATIKSFTPNLIQFELLHKLRKTDDWQRMIARNIWFQQRAVQQLKQYAAQSTSHQKTPILFSYSYAARDLFRYAKSQGWHTVLGQIDPGFLEQQIEQKEQRKYSALAPHWHATPSSYWELWQEECQLADRIVVNSEWSKHLLTKTGIQASKIHCIPLVYKPPEERQNFARHYPAQFSAERPLKVLFLGLVSLRKGIAAVLDAIPLLQSQPIEFWLVGPQQIEIPYALQQHPQVHWVGKVSRSEAQYYYQSADVFLFPTLSDGFGLTQLEAQAWKLPIIASQFCGTVVNHQKNGLVLLEVTGQAIAQSLFQLINHPKYLQQLSDQSGLQEQFSLSTLAQNLQQICQFPCPPVS